MNTINDLEAQDLHDSWSLFYFALAREVLKMDCGEDLLRSIVRAYALKIGEAELAAMRLRGLKPNLENFYLHPAHRFYDPRLLEEKQRLNEQVVLFNVVRCPFAHIARLTGNDLSAKIFCEEFTQACLAAYTNGVSQANLSELLTETRDTHCRIAAYFRPGNSTPEQIQECFSDWKETSHESLCSQDASEAREIWHESAHSLFETFAEHVPQCADRGAEAAAADLAAFVQRRAVSTKNTVSRDFALAHCAPLDFTQNQSPSDKFAVAFCERLGL